MGVYLEVFFHLLSTWLGLLVLGLVVAVFLVSRTRRGKKVGAARLCVVAYLVYLAFLFALGAAQGPESMGYGWLPLLVSTFPWSFLFDPIAGEGLHVGGLPGIVLNFVLLVGIYGGMNSLLFLGVLRTLKSKREPQKV